MNTDEIKGGTDEDDVWLVLLSSSRYWFNYRHSANTLALATLLLQHPKLSPDRIIVLDAATILSERRHPYPGQITISDQPQIGDNLYVNDVKVQYEAEQVNFAILQYVLTGRLPASELNINHQRMIALYPRIHSHQKSKIFLYLTGHGGDEFFKFHDYEEVNAFDFTALFTYMYYHRLYEHIFIILDTCQASTMANNLMTNPLPMKIQSDLMTKNGNKDVDYDTLLPYLPSYPIAPNITFLASSLQGENSYGYHINIDWGVSVVDRFSYLLIDYLRKEVLKFADEHHKSNKKDKKKKSKLASPSLHELYQALQQPAFLHSNIIMLQSPYSTSSRNLPVMDFFIPAKANQNTSKQIIKHIASLPVNQHVWIHPGANLITDEASISASPSITPTPTLVHSQYHLWIFLFFIILSMKCCKFILSTCT